MQLDGRPLTIIEVQAPAASGGLRVSAAGSGDRRVVVSAGARERVQHQRAPRQEARPAAPRKAAPAAAPREKRAPRAKKVAPSGESLDADLDAYFGAGSAAAEDAE